MSNSVQIFNFKINCFVCFRTNAWTTRRVCPTRWRVSASRPKPVTFTKVRGQGSRPNSDLHLIIHITPLTKYSPRYDVFHSTTTTLVVKLKTAESFCWRQFSRSHLLVYVLEEIGRRHCFCVYFKLLLDKSTEWILWKIPLWICGQWKFPLLNSGIFRLVTTAVSDLRIYQVW